MTTMLSFEDAMKTILSSAIPLGRETVLLQDASGRVLFVDISSDVDMPPFDKSAMDGYACRAEDLDNPLEVIETIPAGKKPTREIGPGQCSKIMTGAPVPAGADIVVKVEDTREEDGKVVIEKKSSALNICYHGEDIKTGEMALRAGTTIGPAEIAVLAAVGCAEVPVYKRPRIGIVATGSELVEPSESVTGAMIRNSNSYQLFAQARKAGFEPIYFGIAEDTPEATEEAIEKAAAGSDIVLMSGGVSMGDFDYVPGVLEKLGFTTLFDRVAVKPGRPTLFAMRDSTWVFGLPGNPVSTFVLFEAMVKPFAFKLMGTDYRPTILEAPLARAIKRKKGKRRAYVPATLNENGMVEPVDYHGSAHIHAYAGADGMIYFPEGILEMKEGEKIGLRLFV